MFWHKFRLDWSYALGELLIVTVGVLIALAVNNWNNERSERAQERDVVDLSSPTLRAICVVSTSS